MGLFEPGDGVRLQVVRASRVLPGDVYWGLDRGGSDGFALLKEGVPLPSGATPSGRADRVQLGSDVEVFRDRLVLIEDGRERR